MKDEATPRNDLDQPEVLPPEALGTTAMVQSSSALQVRGDLPAIATMPRKEFSALVKAGKDLRKRLQRIHREVMEEGVDYGKIPGTDKDTLLKPGAEILLKLNKAVAVFDTRTEYGDGVTTPHFVVHSTCYAKDEAGVTVAMGNAACSNWEEKYRWRKGGRECPDCGEAQVNESTFKDEFYCWKKKGGCGHVFPLDDKRITEQSLERQPNEDPYEQLNTVVKIADKRAMVACALLLSAASGSFTQDMEEKPKTGDVPHAASRPGDMEADLTDHPPHADSRPSTYGADHPSDGGGTTGGPPRSASSGGGPPASEKQIRMLQAKCYAKAEELGDEDGNHELARSIRNAARGVMMLGESQTIPKNAVNGLVAAIGRCVLDPETDDDHVMIPEGDI